MEERVGAALGSDFIALAGTLATAGVAIATLALIALGLGLLFWPLLADRHPGGRTPDGQ